MSGKKRSPIWEHFESIDGYKGKCRHCSVVVSFSGGSIGNLARHLRTRHTIVLSVHDSQSTEKHEKKDDSSHLSDPVEMAPTGQKFPNSKKRSRVWEHFDVLEGSKGKCRYCSQVVSCAGGSTGNLTRHLKNAKHQIQQISGEQQQQSKVETTQSIVILEAGNIYTTVENGTETDLVELQTIDTSHLESDTGGHQNQQAKRRRSTRNDTSESISGKKKSHVWDHFEPVEANKGKCRYCSMTLSSIGGSTGNFARHLKKRHHIVPHERSTGEETSQIVILEAADLYGTVKDETNLVELRAVDSSHLSGGIIEGHQSQRSSKSGTTKKPRVWKKRSLVWEHFEPVDGERGRCRHCGMTLTCPVGSTGNLTRHLKKKHPTSSASSLNETSDGPVSQNLLDLEDPSQSSKSFTAKRSQTNIRAKNIERQILKMIVKEYHPFSLVEGSEFKALVKELCPIYSLPSRKTVANSLLQIHYNAAVEKLKRTITTFNPGCVSLSVDGWNSINNDRFISITAHFIDEECEMQSHLLQCDSLQQSPTAEQVADTLINAVNAWGLSDRVLAITTDHTSYMELAMCNLQWQHVRCFAHSVNLVVQRGLDPLRDILTKVRIVVELFRRNSNHFAKLQEIQEQMGMSKQKLKLDVETRWNSTYEMLLRFFRNKEPLTWALGVLELGNEFQIENKEWTAILQAVRVLAIFNSATMEISEEKMVTLSKTIVLARAMMKHINKNLLEESVTDSVRIMCMMIKDELTFRFQDLETNDLHCQALLLDPRFKKDGFSDQSKYLTALEALRAEAEAIVIFSADSEEVSTQPLKKKRIMDEFFIDLYEECKRERPSVPTLTGAAEEVDSYLADENAGIDESPLCYWKLNKHRFPRLFKLAQRILSIPATSVPSEMIFSKAGFTLSQRRSCLPSGKVKEIIFLNHNWK